MKTISMLDMRKRAGEIIKRVESGESYILTYRGRRVGKIISCPKKEAISREDPVYRISEWAGKSGKELTPAEADRLIYG